MGEEEYKKDSEVVSTNRTMAEMEKRILEKILKQGREIQENIRREISQCKGTKLKC